MAKRQTVRRLLERYRKDPGDLTVEELRQAERLLRRLRGPSVSGYEAVRHEARKRSARVSAAGRDIGPLPDVADPARRAATSASLKAFCETYFPQVFYLPWSEDQIEVLATIERAIREGRLFALQMPRGSGKTAMARMGAFWAVLTGRIGFACIIAGAEALAVRLLLGIKRFILSPECETLRADYPEALYPLWQLQNNARRQIGQHIDGEPTDCTWAQDHLIFPTVTGDRLPPALRATGLERSPSAGGIISVTSLDANIRGQNEVRTDGSIVRPGFILLDDPQTRQSARSFEQTRYRLDLIRGDVLPMAGPGRNLAAVIACTVMYEGDLADQIVDREKHPEWQGRRMKAIYAWPRAKKLWARYRELRRDSLRRGLDGKQETDFYAAHRKSMDRGARVAWPARFTPGTHLSALQFLQNEMVRLNDAAFLAEYQGEPAPKQETAAFLVTPEIVMGRLNGRARGEVPLACTHLTGFVDVHDQVLYWCVCAWQDDFTGFVIDYDTLPPQTREHFTLANARRTLRRTYRGMGVDGAINAGLENIVTELLGRSWPKAGGGVLRVDRLLVDMRYKPGIVQAVKRKVGGATMMLSSGVGIRAASRPISQYQRRPGWTLGHNWYIPNVGRTAEFPHVCVDVNYWKTFVHERLALAPGEPGAMTLFGNTPGDHALFAEHVAGSETWASTSGQGRELHEWRDRPDRHDNHWFDCLVGCAAAASMLGARVPGEEIAVRGRPRQHYTKADLETLKWRRGASG